MPYSPRTVTYRGFSSRTIYKKKKLSKFILNIPNDGGRLIALIVSHRYIQSIIFVSLHRCVKKKKENNNSQLKSTIVQSTQELCYLLNVTLCPGVRRKKLCMSLFRLKKRDRYRAIIITLVYIFIRIIRRIILQVDILSRNKVIDERERRERFERSLSLSGW